MMSEIREMLDEYRAWLKDKTTLREFEDSVEITTPYTDRHNDMLQLYVRKHNGGFELSDDGYVIEDLQMQGCNLDTRKREDILRMTLNGLGVMQDGNRLVVHASAENFAAKKHSLIQAMLAVNDLFYLAVPSVASLFYEDVVGWLDLHDVRYTPNVQFVGKSGFSHSIHFVIPRSKSAPERLVEPISRPNKDSVQSLVFKLSDIRENRELESKSYAVLNDFDGRVAPGILDALNNYDVTPILWSHRESKLQELAR